MKYTKKKIAFGIPFKASSHTTALELCLHSIFKYALFEFQVYLQVDITNEELADSFSKKKLLEEFTNVIVRYYKRKRIGDYTQSLVDWVIAESTADYAVFLHSDVFFYHENVFRTLLQPFVMDSGRVISGWVVPFSEYQSTYHISNHVKKNFYIAPRLCTWIYAINISAYKALKISKESLWLGNYHLEKLDKEPFPGDIDMQLFISWISKYDMYNEVRISDKTCLIDIGTFAMYYIEQNEIPFFSLGNASNPDFNTMELHDKGLGYIHIEQYDPERFDDKFYASSLMSERTKELIKILCQYRKM